MESALTTWQAARDALEAAREAVEPAKKRTWTAQFRKAAGADGLTRCFEDARHEAKHGGCATASPLTSSPPAARQAT